MANSVSSNHEQRLVFDLQLEGRLNAAASVGNGITAVFGDSGAGKTTLIRSLAGLQAGVQGAVCFDGVHWLSGERRSLAVEKRRIGYVTQTPALFQHMTVAKNLQFAAKRAGHSKASKQAAAISSLVDLLVKERWQQQPVAMLSGGEAQRVAIARSLLANPQLLLLDEPLSGLDATTKATLMPKLRDLLLELNIPTLIVTHSPLEVATLADHLLLMRDGVIHHQAAVVDMLPTLAAQNVGQPFSMLEAVVVAIDDDDQLIRLLCNEATLWLPLSSRPLAAVGDCLRLIIYARDVSLSREVKVSSSILNRVKVSIVAIEEAAYKGAAELRLALGESVLLATITKRSLRQMQLAVGQELWAQVKSVSLG